MTKDIKAYGLSVSQSGLNVMRMNKEKIRRSYDLVPALFMPVYKVGSDLKASGDPSYYALIFLDESISYKDILKKKTYVISPGENPFSNDERNVVETGLSAWAFHAYQDKDSTVADIINKDSIFCSKVKVLNDYMAFFTGPEPRSLADILNEVPSKLRPELVALI
ncbi:hypothetical protein DRN75_01445 [Nanoarchaeota archaeon]|nr:MAG: hypothetical protein DRN75_01445 [Nanoarchaeota archaeon]